MRSPKNRIEALCGTKQAGIYGRLIVAHFKIPQGAMQYEEDEKQILQYPFQICVGLFLPKLSGEKIALLRDL